MIFFKSRVYVITPTLSSANGLVQVEKAVMAFKKSKTIEQAPGSFQKIKRRRDFDNKLGGRRDLKKQLAVGNTCRKTGQPPGNIVVSFCTCIIWLLV